MGLSKVKNVQGKGTWESNYGTLYQFIYEMEDGTTLQANHKKQDGAFAVGTEVEYEITSTHETYGNKGKVKKPDSGFSGGRKEFDTTGVEVGHAISNGVQIAVAKHGAATELQHIESYARKILGLSAKMKAEVTNAKKAAPKADAIPPRVYNGMNTKTTTVDAIPPAPVTQSEEDDLPF